MKNQDYIDKYKLDNVIIVNEYVDSTGKLINGIISPLKVDNRQIFSPIDFQKDTPHCAGFAAANLCESIIWKNTGKLVQLDAHQIYAKAKEIDGNIKAEGTFPEYTLKAALDLNVFNGKKYAIKTFKNNKTKKSISTIKHLIHKYDFLLGGFIVRQNWYNCNKMKFIINASGKILGGHAVCIVGYDKTGVMIANSWSPEWGAKGFAIVSWDTFKEDFLYCAYLEPIDN